jgi:hypothetical protein
LKQLALKTVLLDRAIKESSFKEWITNKRLLEKVKELECNDDSEVKPEVCAMPLLRKYMNLEAELSKKFIAEGVTVYITQARTMKDTLALSKQAYAEYPDKNDKFKSIPSCLDNYLYYGDPPVLSKRMECQTPAAQAAPANRRTYIPVCKTPAAQAAPAYRRTETTAHPEDHSG